MGGDRDDIGTLPTAPGGGDNGPSALYGADLGEGAQIGNFVIDVRSVRGGFATVYRAKHFRGDGGLRAVKVLHKALVHSPNMVKRFQQEADLIRRLEHPHIVRLEEYGELVDGRPYFVMPWIQGRTLAELLDERGAVSVADAVSMIEELCDALGVAHGAGVVHRDVKPSNILLVDDDIQQVMLVDFGIAKLVGDGVGGRHDMTTSGVRVGTPHYMAPEQILGHRVDGRTDIYALGVCLYQLVTGDLPFRAPTPVEVEEQHLNAPVPRASTVAPTAAPIDRVIARCLEKKPEDRYATVQELASDLRRAFEARAPSGAAPAEEPAAVTVDVIALHVTTRLLAGEDDAGDDAIDALEEVIESAIARCKEQAFDVPIDSGTSFLAVSPLSDDAATEQRRAAIDTALDLVDRCAGTAVHASAFVHELSAEVIVGADERRYVGGELLRLDAWLPADPHPGVVVGATVLAGIDADYEVVDGAVSNPTHRLVRRRTA